MSAYILTDLHISTIAGFIYSDKPDYIIQKLADKLKSINIDSVNFRYNEKTRKTKCRLFTVDPKYSVHDIARLIDCWAYQSCEKPGNIEYMIMRDFLTIRIKALDGDSKQSELWSI
jgi:hypothetical protein